MTRTAAPFKRKIAFRTITSQNLSQNTLAFLCHAPMRERRTLAPQRTRRMDGIGQPASGGTLFLRKGQTPPP